MTPLKLIISSLFHYARRNLLLALGFAISTAVLTGALIVGDSVQHSLQDIVSKRLGQVTHVMESDDRYFTDDLVRNIEEASLFEFSGILMENGIAVADGGRKRLNNVRVLGVDSSFSEMDGESDLFGKLKADSVLVSRNLSERLNLEPGDEFLLRMNRSSLIPLNAPFVSEAENSISARVTVSGIASEDQLGAFNLRTSQTPPFNVFISKYRLQQLMEIGQRSNVLLARAGEIDAADLRDLISTHWKPADGGIQIRADEEDDYLDIQSERVFIEPVITDALLRSEMEAIPHLTYFVNSVSRDKRSTPYSFVSTLEDALLLPDQIILTDWLASDLKAQVGDSITISYYVVGLLRELEVRYSSFVVKKIVPLRGEFVDPYLMPEIPGMSDAGNCRDWETGVPIDLEIIRDKDEDYWTQFKGTPKAYISIGTAKALWKNRFGVYTSLRIEDISNLEKVESVFKDIQPDELGFEIRPVLRSASYSAENGVDFSQLFGGLSFFLLAGAIIMTILIFRLSIEDRESQVKIMAAMGLPGRQISRILTGEGLVIALIGGLLGLGLAYVYNLVIFSALNNVWSDIVRTDMLTIHVSGISLLTGFIISVVLALTVEYVVIRRYLRKTLADSRESGGRKGLKSFKWSWLAGLVALMGGLVIILFQFIWGKGINESLFFIAGGLLLLGGIFLSHGYLLAADSRKAERFNLRSLSWKNAVSNINRSLAIIILMAMGTFIVISTGSNRKDLFSNIEDSASGTGGFLYYAESTIPVLKDLNDPEYRYEMGLDGDYSFLQMRISEGDDASCLNLNRITQPRILGADPFKLEGRFTFITAVDELDPQNPWSTLSQTLAENVIPAIADETVIKWGLGMEVGDTLVFQDARGELMKLRLVGGTAPSIFQGSVIISEDHFLKHFPSSSGSQVFLVEGALADTASIHDELSMGMRDLGWTMELTGKRLAEFNSVTNTYLSIFMILGALGLLLGTIGLGMVIFRSIIERRTELGLMKALGYSLGKLRRMVAREYLLLFIAGTVIGGVSSLVATLPAFISRNTDASLPLIFIILGVLVVNGLIWIYSITSVALSNKPLVNALRND